MEKKPFIFGVATSGDNFTDRKRDLTTGIEFPAWSEYGTDFASSLGENLFGAESVSLGAVRQIESRLYRYFFLP